MFSFVPMALLAAACHSFSEEPNTHPPLSLSYELIWMDGYEVSLERDKKVMGAENIKPTILTVYNNWGSEVEWEKLSFGQGCLTLINIPDGVAQTPDWCSELVSIDGTVQEYLPYVAARKNFVEKIVPEIQTQHRIDGDIEWRNAKDVRIAHFRFLEAAE